MTDARTLEEWLAYIAKTHISTIDMGLARVGQVADAANLIPWHTPSIIVAGTNGKGSTVTAAERCLLAHGAQVGATLSPHVVRFNERVRIGGEEASDAQLIEAFSAVEDARGGVPLTYFEFSALAAMWCFKASGVSHAVFEVGLGGRLDAFNLIDADVAVITSIGLDHQEYLGETLDAIGAEKSGVMRGGQTVVLGPDMPPSVEQAASIADTVLRFGDDIESIEGEGWALRVRQQTLEALPEPAIARTNVALGIAAAGALIPLRAPAVVRAIAGMTLFGRMTERRFRERRVLIDVAHNPAGARFLRAQITRREMIPTVAIYGALADKDARGVVAEFASMDLQWITVTTGGERGLSGTDLAAQLPQGLRAEAADGLLEALGTACSYTAPDDVILLLGSFAIAEQASRVFDDPQRC